MATPSPLAIGDKVISVSSATLATVLYIPVSGPGRVKDFQVSLGAALATANETWTLAYADPGSTTFTNITGGVVTIAFTGSAAGNVGRAQLTPGITNAVTDGGCIRITPSGGGSGAVPVGFALVIGN